MYNIIDGRSTGKTGRLMLLAKEHNGIIVCSRPDDMLRKSLGYGIVGITFISYDDYLKDTKSYEDTPIFIDEVEIFLHHINKNIKGYTLSNKD